MLNQSTRAGVSPVVLAILSREFGKTKDAQAQEAQPPKADQARASAQSVANVSPVPGGIESLLAELFGINSIDMRSATGPARLHSRGDEALSELLGRGSNRFTFEAGQLLRVASAIDELAALMGFRITGPDSYAVFVRAIAATLFGGKHENTPGFTSTVYEIAKALKLPAASVSTATHKGRTFKGNAEQLAARLVDAWKDLEQNAKEFSTLDGVVKALRESLEKATKRADEHSKYIDESGRANGRVLNHLGLAEQYLEHRDTAAKANKTPPTVGEFLGEKVLSLATQLADAEKASKSASTGHRYAKQLLSRYQLSQETVAARLNVLKDYRDACADAVNVGGQVPTVAEFLAKRLETVLESNTKRKLLVRIADLQQQVAALQKGSLESNAEEVESFAGTRNASLDAFRPIQHDTTECCGK